MKIAFFTPFPREGLGSARTFRIFTG